MWFKHSGTGSPCHMCPYLGLKACIIIKQIISSSTKWNHSNYVIHILLHYLSYKHSLFLRYVPIFGEVWNRRPVPILPAQVIIFIKLNYHFWIGYWVQNTGLIKILPPKCTLSPAKLDYIAGSLVIRSPKFC